MSDNLVLDMLRAIRSDLTSVRASIVELTERVGLVESGLAALSRRVDRMGGDVEHIKRRLDIVDEGVR
jgi:hypothetical protein